MVICAEFTSSMRSMTLFLNYTGRTPCICVDENSSRAWPNANGDGDADILQNGTRGLLCHPLYRLGTRSGSGSMVNRICHLGAHVGIPSAEVKGATGYPRIAPPHAGRLKVEVELGRIFCYQNQLRRTRVHTCIHSINWRSNQGPVNVFVFLLFTG